MKNLSDIDKQIKAVKEELTALEVRKATLQDRIRQLKGLKHSIAEEQLPFSQRSVSISKGGQKFFTGKSITQIDPRVDRCSRF